jgi:hypothetical protein
VFSSSDLLHQLVSDRQQELLRTATAARNAPPSRVRRHLARSLRRAADRLDEATAAPGSMSGAHHPGRGLPTSGVSGP